MNTRPVLFLALWLCCTTASAKPVSEIVFEGNATTKDKILRQELLLTEGDEADSKLIEATRQAIMNLGLFKSVKANVEETDSGQRLIFIVEERYFLLPIPLIGGNSEDEYYSYGFELRHDNVGGVNRRLKISIEERQYPNLVQPAERNLSIKFTIPRIIDTPFSLSLNGEHKSNFVFEQDHTGTTTGSYLQEVNSGGFFVSRWVEPNWISQGWRVGTGISAIEKSYYQQQGSGLTYDDSQSLAISASISYNNIQEHQYHRAGTSYSYSASVALPKLGSDYAYTRHHINYRRYHPMASLDANINSQFQLKVANGRAFGSPTYSIGSSQLLRGYENGYSEGDAMMLLNLEYHHHISGYRQLRAVLFADAGNAWESALDMDIGDMPVGVGVGLRWRVQSFVDLTLRVDYARALQYDNETLILTTSASF